MAFNELRQHGLQEQAGISGLAMQSLSAVLSTQVVRDELQVSVHVQPCDTDAWKAFAQGLRPHLTKAYLSRLHVEVRVGLQSRARRCRDGPGCQDEGICTGPKTDAESISAKVPCLDVLQRRS